MCCRRLPVAVAVWLGDGCCNHHAAACNYNQLLNRILAAQQELGPHRRPRPPLPWRLPCPPPSPCIAGTPRPTPNSPALCWDACTEFVDPCTLTCPYLALACSTQHISRYCPPLCRAGVCRPSSTNTASHQPQPTTCRFLPTAEHEFVDPRTPTVKHIAGQAVYQLAVLYGLIFYAPQLLGIPGGPAAPHARRQLAFPPAVSSSEQPAGTGAAQCAAASRLAPAPRAHPSHLLQSIPRWWGLRSTTPWSSTRSC